MTPDELAAAAVTMATLPPHVNMLEAIVLPVMQPYLGAELTDTTPALRSAWGEGDRTL